jgi:hypothetical protein
LVLVQRFLSVKSIAVNSDDEGESNSNGESHARLHDIADPGTCFLYRYDIGDNCKHEITVEKELIGDEVQTPSTDARGTRVRQRMPNAAVALSTSFGFTQSIAP